jgi:hypothetical protein
MLTGWSPSLRVTPRILFLPAIFLILLEPSSQDIALLKLYVDKEYPHGTTSPSSRAANSFDKCKCLLCVVALRCDRRPV